MKTTGKQREKMTRAYRLDVAKFIAVAARNQRFVTYQDLESEFGIIARNWGDILGGIAIRLREHGLPLLPVVVVLKGTTMPSEGAVLYDDLGLTSSEDIMAEQRRCFDFDWGGTILGKS